MQKTSHVRFNMPASLCRKTLMRKELKVLLVMMLALLGTAARAQVQPAPFAPIQFLDNNGRPAVGACLFTSISGSNTPLASYSDYLGTVLNSNPVVLDSSGRARVFLSSTSYRLMLKTRGGINCSLGVMLWQVDGINPSANSLLASNNIWAGTNTWNSTATFNSTTSFTAGFTSSGPSNLNAGGALIGSFSGSPAFTGLPNFSGGLMSTTGVFSGQITNTVPIGTPPFVITSSTVVPNLDANYLQGCTWSAPCVIGSIAPSQGYFSMLTATTSFALNGSATLTSVQGTDVKLISGSFSGGAGTPVCVDTNLGLGNTGCPTAPKLMQDITYCASGCTVTGTPCTTSGASNASCSNVITWPNGGFVDSAYSANCSGIGPTGVVTIRGITKTASTVTVFTANGTNDGSAAGSYAELDCHGGHN
jgi:hypothetical protein